MEKIVVANLKMNFNEEEIIEYKNKINKFKSDNINLFIAPTFIYLNQFNSKLYNLTSQDVSMYENGSYTGEVSASQLKSIGVNSVIIGHYERRKFFQENCKIINKKIKVALENNLKVILCICEKKAEDIFDEIEKDLFEIKNYDNLVIAYEPSDIMGTYNSPNIDSIINVIKLIKEKYNTKVIYGGNVCEENIEEICNLTDGVIVGKKTLDVTKFINMMKKIQ